MSVSLTTAVAYPYAMIIWNNGAKLIYLKRYNPERDTYSGHTMRTHWSKANWGELHKTKYEVQRTGLVKAWRCLPSAIEVKRAACRAASLLP